MKKLIYLETRFSINSIPGFILTDTNIIVISADE